MDEVDFLFLLGILKKIKRSGWAVINVPEPESIAEHSFRTAAIAYFLAKKEGLSESECGDAIFLALFHDAHESLIGDLTKLNRKYIKVKEEKAKGELPIYDKLKSIERNKRIVEIVKDADLLEMFFQAKEYESTGNKVAKFFFHPQKLKTKSAKKLYREMKKRDAYSWMLNSVDW